MATAPWPDSAWIADTWPQLGPHLDLVRVGSGWRTRSELGWVHVKRRPHHRIQVEVWVLTHLHAHGTPVTVPLLARDGARFRLWGDEAIWVYRELPGEVRANPSASTMPGDFEAIGAAAAELDLALAELDLSEAVALGLPVRAQPLGSVAPQQITHRDFHADNVLFEADEDGGLRLSGFLDFDHLELGPRIVDLCHPATSALARLWEQTSQGSPQLPKHHAEHWFTLWRSVMAGYASRITLSPEEVAACAEMMVGIEEDFATWFTEISDPANAQFSRDLGRFTQDHAHRIVGIARQVSGRNS